MANLADLLMMARHRFEICHVKAEEKIVILADPDSDKVMVDAFYSTAVARGGDPALIICEAGGQRSILGQNHPDYVVDAMLKADIVFDLSSIPPWYSDSHAKLTSGKHARIALVGGSEAALIANLRYPPDPVIGQRCMRAQRMIDGSKTLRITSPLGTDLTVERGDIDEYRSLWQGGGVVNRGEHRDVLGGWVALTVPESGVNGIVYFVGGYDIVRGIQHQIVDEPVIMEIEKGRLRKISGRDAQAILLDGWFRSWGDPNSYRFAHINLGLDHRARFYRDPGAYLHCIYGSVLLAFGTNYSPTLFGMGAKVRAKSHIDMTLVGADLYLDSELVLHEGEFTVGSGLMAS